MEMKNQYRLGAVTKANDDGSIKFRLITDAVDSYGEVVLPKGARIDRIEKNPIWLWCHNQEMWGGIIRPPIGKMNTNTIEIDENHFDVDIEFDEKNDDFAKMIAAKHRDGFLNACSVGFQPIGISNEPARDGQKGVTHVDYMVLEGSSVPIPANPEAVQQREWGEFLAACEKYGFGIDGIKAGLKMGGWQEYEIKQATDKKIQVAAGNYEIKVVEKPEPVDSEKLSHPFDLKKSIAEIRQRLIHFKDEVYSNNIELTEAEKTLLADGLEALKKAADYKQVNTFENDVIGIIEKYMKKEIENDPEESVETDLIEELSTVEEEKNYLDELF